MGMRERSALAGILYEDRLRGQAELLSAARRIFATAVDATRRPGRDHATPAVERSGPGWHAAPKQTVVQPTTMYLRSPFMLTPCLSASGFPELGR
jgi:hypothetical protein